MQEHTGSDRSCLWHTLDFADYEFKKEIFAIRFGSMEILMDSWSLLILNRWRMICLRKTKLPSVDCCQMCGSLSEASALLAEMLKETKQGFLHIYDLYPRFFKL